MQTAIDNTNRCPQCESRFNVSCTSNAKPAKPFIMSVWPVASHTRTSPPNVIIAAYYVQHPRRSIDATVNPHPPTVLQLDQAGATTTAPARRIRRASHHLARLARWLPGLRRDLRRQRAFVSGAAITAGTKRVSQPVPRKSTPRAGNARRPGWRSRRFDVRRRRPPPDPVNAVISFVTSLLHRKVLAVLPGLGLHPGIGVLHTTLVGDHACASDIIEALRGPFAEALAVTLLNTRMTSTTSCHWWR